ncbi:MAG: cell division initiation protein [Actinomycetota bacterium]|nr:cell division initiation protein [Actinomycetota bacterium]
MEITPRELRDVEIREAFRGYSRDEVNELLERAAASLDVANERVQQMSERLNTAQSETGHTRETEDILHRTLLLAQRAADEAVNEAAAKARQMVDDAEIQARRLTADAEADARRRGESERRRLEEEILDFATRRDTLLADVEALTRFEADYRDRSVRALEADLAALRSRPPASPGARPEPSDVEIPVPPADFTRPEPERREQEAAAAFAPPPAAPSTSHPAAYQPAVSSSPPPNPFASPPIAPASPPAYSSPAYTDPAPRDQESESSRRPDESTQAVDVQALFDRASEGTPVQHSFEQPAAKTTTAAQPEPSEAMDPEVLDDDAFFATLREAVHDETPLGPRDEDSVGEHSFFDNEDDRAGFRDVFRRRR